MLYVAWLATTHCSAAMIVLTSEAPLAPEIFSEMIFACVAMPAYLPLDDTPLPAMMPAMKVP